VQTSTLVDISETITICRDPKDNILSPTANVLKELFVINFQDRISGLMDKYGSAHHMAGDERFSFLFSVLLPHPLHLPPQELR
jgi:hypothetical protein